MKYLGIDWGEARIGLAIGDDEVKIASPYSVVSAPEEIIGIIKEEEIDCLVIGKPVSLVDPNFPVSKKFEKFVNYLKENTEAGIEFLDERLSSKAADALAGDKKTKASRDEIAAMLILQQFLDQQ